MSKDEALELALEELENCADLLKVFDAPIDSCVGASMLQAEKAITAIKKVRALDKKAENARELGLDYEPADGTQVSKVWWDGEKLMAKPIPLEDFYQPVQEPVAWRKLNGFRFDYIEHQPALSGMVSKEWKPLYDTTPPAAQRQWVGLTDEEISEAYNAASRKALYGMGTTREDVYEAIEAKLKEKNT